MQSIFFYRCRQICNIAGLGYNENVENAVFALYNTVLVIDQLKLIMKYKKINKIRDELLKLENHFSDI